MGRCYEFGVAVHEGCEQAMVVPPEGGKCVCPTCEVECLGKFEGCEAVISRPFYIPPSAPEWARPDHERPVPMTATRRSRRKAAAARNEVHPPEQAPLVRRPGERVQGSGPRWEFAEPKPGRAVEPVEAPLPVPTDEKIGELTTLVEAALARPDRALEAIQHLNMQMQARDEELALTFARLTEAYGQLSAEVSADSEARLALTHAVEEFARQVQARENRPRWFRSRGA
jgi:hypothetical protein